ncbi:Gfo/Idh/MocA family protein [Terriglobus sp.]|uniref:Gfo/Idh/MocA family protein n=1 Tax=Terriglobus sp. TaxID=1889013 RepID=UPI003B004133
MSHPDNPPLATPDTSAGIPTRMTDETTHLPAETGTTRRSFLQTAATGMGTLAALTAAPGLAAQQNPNAQNKVQLSPINNTATEQSSKTPGPYLPPGRRVGYAIVGIGRLSIDQILPAFATSKYCKPVALVSGDRNKASRIAAQYGIPDSNITDYQNYERLKDMPGVEAIYVVLPNSMHKEFTVRGARIGKHILCEKPMATSSADCEAMIAACKQANVRLMIAYRQQYEPMNRFLQETVKAGKLGKVRSVIASHSQNEGDPTQWRLKRALAGGGCLPDVGVYCLNGTRFLTDEEPEEVTAMTVQPKDDPRFAEVESRCSFLLRFPSGMVATLTCAYDVHHSSFLRMEGTEAMAEMDPAFGYHGAKLRFSKLGEADCFGIAGTSGDPKERKEVEFHPEMPDKDQFALEMDHFSQCVMNNRQPRTPGEEGLQDQRIMDAIYKSAATGHTVRIPPPNGPTRGPLPEQNG